MMGTSSAVETTCSKEGEPRQGGDIDHKMGAGRAGWQVRVTVSDAS